MIKVSIIIPILNEVDAIHRLLLHIEKTISKDNSYEVIVVDGGSSDGSQELIQDFQDVILIEAQKGRAKQMNAGAKIAKGTILYFLHCDSFPPKDFDLEIIKHVDKGNLAGCFRMKFDYKHPVLLVSQWFTRFNHISCRGGDQSLFVTKYLFDKIDGFNESYIIYEDNEIIKRLYQEKQFVVIPKYLITSARRYRINGAWKLQYHFTIIHLKRKLGHSVKSLLNYYSKNVK
ncbi:Probable Glycosyl transferase, group 2 family protein [Flavobacterium indicum GPTSA100-9 = DSM 17447]|uniref:Probable Glycosyl transferase, group 2 family protein n=1 Tax=Flavobacterium indicum (strain DSM 17447 / CIP 109464 / GPTSA100-9) TaxID=1094466 RepID=H8XTQ9_FLAIG|nr:TIGR04283 family arsenosugar biosynthesis glycosyltransferase [Flavobacterium indicum]CCG53639.1 Probable Glycosyl transferase, group 2 family protein [Flavobacterium indicum GPTSA100-9 = DSM 17447]